MELSWLQVALAMVPVVAVFFIYGRAVNDWTSVAWASTRMVAQLIGIGYCLAIIFGLNQPHWVLLVVLIMSVGAGWISLRPIRKYHKPALPMVLSVILSGGINLIWILAAVLRPDPWYQPSVVIPITGMVMANSMNAVSLCAERFWAELEQHQDAKQAAQAAMNAAMIPQINSLMAVGLVSLPGMMTGQILSGVSPLIAVRYQIVIMAMVLATAAMGSYLYLWWHRRAQ